MKFVDRLLRFFNQPGYDPKNWKRWILLAICIRVLILVIFVHGSYQIYPERILSGFAVEQNDYGYFLGPVDQYFDTGMFQYENMPGKPFAGRMPGYSLPYMLLRFAFSKPVALTLLFAAQVLLSCVCVYLLALTALRIFRKREAFVVAFILFAVSMHTAVFDIFSLTESFAVSATILYLYFGVRYFDTRKRADAVWAGVFAAWAVFLRPFLGTYLALLPLVLLLSERPLFSWKKVMVPSLWFLVPFVVFESAWIYRNYQVLNRFIPLETSLSESYGERGAYRTSAISIRALIASWGGETGEFYQGSEAEWFHHKHGDDVRSYRFPARIYNSVFTFDSLVLLKHNFNMSVDPSMSEAQKDSLNMLASETALRYADAYRSANPFRYYVLNPFIRAGRLVFSNGTRLMPLPPFSGMSLFQKAVKIFYAALYYMVTFGGIVGMLFYLLKRRPYAPGAMLLLLSPFILVLTLVVYSSIYEFRYFLTGYPVLIVFFTWLLVRRPQPATSEIHTTRS